MAIYDEFYWSKLADGELWLQYCTACRKYIFYPRSFCPICAETVPEWRQASGQARLYSYTTVYVSSLPEFADDVPYVYAIVELDEGVRMPANILNCSPEDLRINLPLELTIIKKGDKSLPAFQPLSL